MQPPSSSTSSKYEASLNRHYNHRMQLIFPSPAARPVSPPPAPSLAPSECDSRRSSFNDGEQLKILRDVKKEEEVEFEIRCRIRGLERYRDEDKEWVDCEEEEEEEED